MLFDLGDYFLYKLVLKWSEKGLKLLDNRNTRNQPVKEYTWSKSNKIVREMVLQIA